MACPYFYPTEPMSSGLWPYPERLPLGGGWHGRCTAVPHEPEDDVVEKYCNLGYATACAFLPPERNADAVRFGVSEAGGVATVLYVYECAHSPADIGIMRLNVATGAWDGPENPCLRRMAECVAKTRRRG